MSYGFTPNPDHVPSKSSFAPLPAGTYSVVVVKAEMREPKETGGGKSTAPYLNVEFDVLDEAYQGRKVWWRCHLWNNQADEERREKTKSIAADQMNAFCFSAGCKGWNDPADLVGYQAMVTLKIQKGTGGYEDKNEIRTFEFDVDAPHRLKTGEGGQKVAIVQQAATNVTKPAAAPAAKKGWA